MPEIIVETEVYGIVEKSTRSSSVTLFGVRMSSDRPPQLFRRFFYFDDDI